MSLQQSLVMNTTRVVVGIEQRRPGLTTHYWADEAGKLAVSRVCRPNKWRYFHLVEWENALRHNEWRALLSV